jgi:hypothetical protein
MDDLYITDLDDDFIDNIDSGFKYYESIIDWDWFKHLWTQSANQYAYFELAKSVKPDLTFDKWDYGWQYRTVNHPDYEQAQIEFINILIGWF